MDRCPVHRELPARRCKEKGCGTWLTSANPSDRCVEHGGWRKKDRPKPAEQQIRQTAKQAALNTFLTFG